MTPPSAWASSSAPWKLDASLIEVVNVDGVDTLYLVGGIAYKRQVFGARGLEAEQAAAAARLRSVEAAIDARLAKPATARM